MKNRFSKNDLRNRINEFIHILKTAHELYNVISPIIEIIKNMCS